MQEGIEVCEEMTGSKISSMIIIMETIFGIFVIYPSSRITYGELLKFSNKTKMVRKKPF